MQKAKRVVVIDDELLIALHLEKLCAESGAEVVGVAHDATSGQEIILREKPDYVIIDLRLGEQRDGVDVAQTVMRELPQTKFIFVTATEERVSIERIESVKPQEIFIKPIQPGAVGRALS